MSTIQRRLWPICLAYFLWIAIGCSEKGKQAELKQPNPTNQAQPSPLAEFHVNPNTAGSISGTVRYAGRRPIAKTIDMSEDPACVTANQALHHGKPMDESLEIGRNGSLANAFVYIKDGLTQVSQGKRFAIPSEPAVIDQNGCWFHPRVLGIQTGQILKVTNSDPVTHNIHPMAEINREWNHSQGAGDAPLARKFIKPEVMIRVKCNIHSWMHAYIGVVDDPYFAVSKADGSFSIGNLPAGTYTLGIWQERLGTQEVTVTVDPHKNTKADIVFKEK